MIKFSIIVPIYNVEKYLNRCLESILLQCYENYEVIMVCDKSSDKSDKIAKEYEKKHSKFKRVYYENTGLAKAKNIGIKNAIGDYLLFLDGDDFLEKDLLKILSKEIEKDTEIIRFQIREVFDDKSVDYNEKSFKSMNGTKAFNIIKNFHFVEPSWAYCYKKDFWKKNKFKFMDDCLAEDFGLTPLIISKAKNVKCIDYIGYNYVQRSNSLMSNENYKSRIKKMDDIIKQSEFLFNNIDDTDNNRCFYEFISNSLITQVTSLKYKDYKIYIKRINKFGIYKYLPNDSFKRKVKVFLIRLNPYLYKKSIGRLL